MVYIKNTRMALKQDIYGRSIGPQKLIADPNIGEVGTNIVFVTK